MGGFFSLFKSKRIKKKNNTIIKNNATLIGTSRVIGIDLGTTNSVVAVIEGGKLKVIANAEGSRITPSVVAINKDGDWLVGQIAKRQAITNPENTVFSIKRFVGRRFDDPAIQHDIKLAPYKIGPADNNSILIWMGGKWYSPQEILAKILRKMKQTAEDYLGERVTDAIITVPAYFSDSQRQSIKETGHIAGLNVLRIINEPTAASLAYGLDKKEDQHIAVYHLGGGTLDISILQLGEGVFEVKATNGNTHLGGDDFDHRIIDWMCDEFKKEQGIDLRQDKMTLQRLKEAAEKAKCELSSVVRTNINLPYITVDASGPKNLVMTLTRTKLEQLVEDLIEKTLIPCKNALKDAKLGIQDLGEVVLVGQQTRMPAVQEAVRKFFDKAPHKGVNPAEVVALGAAVQGGVFTGSVKEVLLMDVTPFSLGLETVGGVFTKLIERNTTIPTRKSQMFSTTADNQTAVSINVLQGEREMAADNKTLGRFDLVGIPPAPKESPQIEVAFDIDANGIVHVSAKDLGTGKEQKIRITAFSGLTYKEIDRLIKEAEEYAEDAEKKRVLIELRNQADTFVYTTEKAVKEHGDKISDEDKKKINAAIENLKKAMGGQDAQAINNGMEQLTQASHTLAEVMYAQAAQAGAGTEFETSNQEEEVFEADFEVVEEEDAEREVVE